MSALSRLLGSKYDDVKLVMQAESALEADPLLTAASNISVQSVKGVLTLTGSVRSDREKNRVEGVVRGAIKTSGLKFDRLVNDVVVKK